MSRNITLFAIAIATTLSITFAGSVNGQTQTTQTRRTVAVPPPGGLYQPNYGNQSYKIGIRGFSNGSSVQVQEVFPGTAADRLLLEAGDRIVSVNGMDVRNMSDLAMRLRDAAINRGGNITVLIDNVRARYGEYGAQRYVTHSTYLSATPQPTPLPPSGPAIITPNQIDGYDSLNGTIYSSNTQIDSSALNLYRNASRNNGTMRNVRRPIYDQMGNLVGFQEGQVWNNSVTGQEHGNLNNTTVDQNGNVHRQRQIKAVFPK
ncbi:MAG: PDZ domain-containing protein [Planctomycetota bacterium]